MTNINENNSTAETDNIQSHWGSGVKLTVNSFTQKTLRDNPQAETAKNGFSHLSVLFGFAATLLLLLGFAYYLAAQNNPVSPPSASSEKIVSKENPADDSDTKKDKLPKWYDGKTMYGDKHVIPVRARRVPLSLIDCCPALEYRLVYEPRWVAVFGTVTKGQNYSGINVCGMEGDDMNWKRIVSDEQKTRMVLDDASMICDHIFDGSSFRNAVITDFVFEHCSFRNADFTSATFTHVYFRNCDLTGANFFNVLFDENEDDANQYDGANDFTTSKGLTLEQIKQTSNYRLGLDYLSDFTIRLPPDIKKALEKEQKQKDAQKEK